MKTYFTSAIIVSLYLLLAAGCAESTCDTIEEACGEHELWDNCVDNYNDGSSDCKKAMRNYADCVEEKGCNDECASEWMKVQSECDWK